jgi:hypothetical protein
VTPYEQGYRLRLRNEKQPKLYDLNSPSIGDMIEQAKRKRGWSDADADLADEVS